MPRDYGDEHLILHTMPVTLTITVIVVKVDKDKCFLLVS